MISRIAVVNGEGQLSGFWLLPNRQVRRRRFGTELRGPTHEADQRSDVLNTKVLETQRQGKE
jgi:hypothetical protein